jgi:hypothetical protein
MLFSSSNACLNWVSEFFRGNYLMENNCNGIIADLRRKGEVTLLKTWCCCICFAINNCIIARKGD